MSKKILFFIESLPYGGKERRLIELLIYLKKNTDYELRLVLIENTIQYSYVHDLEIQIDVIERKYFKKDPSFFIRFYRIAKQFNPDIIHTWGRMSTFYSILTKLLLRKPLLSNLIASAKKPLGGKLFFNFIIKTNVYFADVILSNSMAGIKAYNLYNHPKTHLIYNGVRLERFDVKEKTSTVVKETLNITANLVVMMVASVNKNKDYDLFLDVAQLITCSYNNITFIGIGGGSEFERIKSRIHNENIQSTLLLGMRSDIEKLISIADICLLLTNKQVHAEGISNSIIEYMAMGKPVITTDSNGGSDEIIVEGASGYIIEADACAIKNKIIELISKPELRKQLGSKGKQIIDQKFTIERMGQDYVDLYNKHFK